MFRYCSYWYFRVKSLEIIKELNLSKYVFPLIDLCVGYPDDDPGIKPRLPVFFALIKNMMLKKQSSGFDEYDQIYNFD